MCIKEVVVIKVFKDISSLLKYIQKQANEILVDEVAEEVGDIIHKHVISDVYGAYTPVEYQRRSDGISDRDNIVGELVGDGKIFVKNIAEPNESVFGTAYAPGDDTEFSKWINYGLSPMLYRGKDGNTHRLPTNSPERPFMDNAREEVRQTKAHIKVLQSELEKKGIKTKK